MPPEPLIIEAICTAPIEKIWSAITDKNEMKQWYFSLADFKAVAGFEFRFTGGTPEKEYLHLCTVTEVVPGRKLTYSWRYEGYEGNSFVTFELFDEGVRTKVKLVHAGLETFPKSNPDFATHNFAVGWTDIIGRSLKEYVEKQ
jgi:uncharacterized protein YndB with AHSA1/START domain